MIRKWLSVVGSLALLFSGCAKRQSGPEIVYVPAPPAAAEKSTRSAVLVIQEPHPAAPAVTPAPPAPHPAAPSRPPAVVRVRPAVPHFAPVPVLGPRESPAEQKALRQAILRSQQEVQQAIERLRRSGLPENEQGTLGGAQVFLAGSIRSLQDNDLESALNLVRKAQLLVRALESSP